MAEVSAIEWTHATFNPWIGCTKLSAACDHCYAETLSKARLGVPWGAGQPRRRTAASTWKAPLSWNRKAAKEGRRMRVFCASLADVFDAEVPDAWRADLFGLIDQTPNLDWLLLTKRPAVARKVMPETPRPNVWLGTTVEDEKMAELRIPHLLATPAAVRFLSMEPLLGPVDLTRIVLGEGAVTDCVDQSIKRMRFTMNALVGAPKTGIPGLDWVISGGESGPGARPTHPDWFRSIRDQCAAAGVPFLFKQHGDWAPISQHPVPAQTGVLTEQTVTASTDATRIGRTVFIAGHGPDASSTIMDRVGKKAAGRYLDGVLHDGYPVQGGASHG